MLSLDSPRWAELDDAFGETGAVPRLLRVLEAEPNVHSESISVEPEPFGELGQRICHQLDVYPAAFAAVPHVVRIADLATGPITLDYFCLPALVHERRDRLGPRACPADLREAYDEAVRRLPSLLPRVAAGRWDEPVARNVLSGILGLRGLEPLARWTIDRRLPAFVVERVRAHCLAQKA